MKEPGEGFGSPGAGSMTTTAGRGALGDGRLPGARAGRGRPVGGHLSRLRQVRRWAMRGVRLPNLGRPAGHHQQNPDGDGGMREVATLTQGNLALTG